MQQEPVAQFVPTFRSVTQFWRAGRVESAPAERPNPGLQGSGRFDDPLHLVPVLYCGDDISTCVYEIIDAFGVSPHHEAPEVLSNVPASTEDDEAEDARRDMEIAKRRRRVPPAFFRRCAMVFETEQPAQLYDLSVVANRTALDAIPAVSVLRIRHEYRELDLSAVTSPHRELTQTIANELMRGELAEGVDGIANPSRRQGTIYALFYDDRSELRLREVYRSEPFCPDDEMIRGIAQQLGLTSE